MAHNHPWLLYFDSLSMNGLNVSCLKNDTSQYIHVVITFLNSKFLLHRRSA